VDGIDALLIGASDLPADMGIYGEIGHPRLAEAFRAVADPCRKAGKILGMGGVYDEDCSARYVALGARFVLTGSDHSFILAAGRARAAALRIKPGLRPAD
jgi:2-keto-3-deoxy-L-rhamnonate aldolase RhmA